MKDNSYHHGDLTNALISESLKIVKKEGVHKLSIRYIAKKTGVSHAAPYRHFKNSEGLLIAIAVKGFNMLDQYINKAISKYPDDDYYSLITEVGRAYIKFCVNNPDLYRIMFGDHIRNKTESRELFLAMDVLFKKWIEIFGKLNTKNKTTREGMMINLIMVWSMLHGYSSFIIDNNKDKYVGSEAQISLILKKLINFIS